MVPSSSQSTLSIPTPPNVPSTMQRSTLCGFLLVDSVKGLVNAAYTIIPPQQWESLASPSLPTFFNVSALPTLQDLPSGYPISFSHGHRKAALQAMLDQPETRDAVVDMYGEELMKVPFGQKSAVSYHLAGSLGIPRDPPGTHRIPRELSGTLGNLREL
ncbi:hypothetical protein C8Q76DRAFT_858858 [Earliella scabrosa]|nr:hypothetical protein C8Q76DRAFT_858858 [Earliella scabrosa]